jgi:hypothetical protein
MHQKKAPTWSFFLMHVFPESGTKNYEQLKHRQFQHVKCKTNKCHAYIVHDSTRLTFSRFRSKIVLYFRVSLHIVKHLADSDNQPIKSFVRTYYVCQCTSWILINKNKPIRRLFCLFELDIFIDYFWGFSNFCRSYTRSQMG